MKNAVKKTVALLLTVLMLATTGFAALAMGGSPAPRGRPGRQPRTGDTAQPAAG